MTKEIVQSIALGQSAYIVDQLEYWSVEQPKFVEFLKLNCNKVGNKFRKAKQYQDARDVLAELDVAYRLLNHPNYKLTYEPFGKKGCDFRVTSELDNFLVEVKRVRQSDAMSKYYHCFEELYKALRAIPSQLMTTLDWSVLSPGPEFADKVSDQLLSIQNELISIINEWNQKIEPNGIIVCELTSFPKAKLKIEHVSEKSVSLGTSLNALHPLLFTQRESFKFSDLLLGCIRQLSEQEANVLVIRLHSDTLFEQELPMAYKEIERHAQEGDEDYFRKKRIDGIGDYEQQIMKLSAVVVITGRTLSFDDRSLNLVWTNPKASMPLKQTHLYYFENM